MAVFEYMLGRLLDYLMSKKKEEIVSLNASFNMKRIVYGIQTYSNIAIIVAIFVVYGIHNYMRKAYELVPELRLMYIAYATMMIAVNICIYVALKNEIKEFNRKYNIRIDSDNVIRKIYPTKNIVANLIETISVFVVFMVITTIQDMSNVNTVSYIIISSIVLYTPVKILIDAVLFPSVKEKYMVFRMYTNKHKENISIKFKDGNVRKLKSNEQVIVTYGNDIYILDTDNIKSKHYEKEKIDSIYLKSDQYKWQ